MVKIVKLVASDDVGAAMQKGSWHVFPLSIRIQFKEIIPIARFSLSISGFIFQNLWIILNNMLGNFFNKIDLTAWDEVGTKL